MNRFNALSPFQAALSKAQVKKTSKRTMVRMAPPVEVMGSNGDAVGGSDAVAVVLEYVGEGGFG